MLDRIALEEECEVRLVRTQQERSALKRDWRALEEVSSGAILFQTFDWCEWALGSTTTSAGDGPFIATVYHKDKLIGLLPLRLVHKMGRSVLTGLAEPFQEFTDMLIHPAYLPSRVFGIVLPELKKSGADYLHLGQVRRDSSLFAAINGRIPGVGELDLAPYVDIGAWEDHAHYFRSVRAATRKNIRNTTNKLEKSAPVRFFHVVSGEQSAHQAPCDLLSQVIDDTYAGREAWLEEKGLTSRAFGNADFQHFVNGFKDRSSQTIRVLAMRLVHGETPIAEQWGFLHKGRYYAYIMSWSPAYAAFSPGKMKMQEVVRTCFELCLDRAEFMIPFSPYKQTWATHSVEVQDHVLPFTWKGRLYAAVWLDRVRPGLKMLAYRTPASLRKIAKRALTRQG